MKLLTGKRIGQSGGELATAVSFSLFLHAVALLGALFLSFHLSARVIIPPYYRVNLVDLPADVPVTAPAEPTAPAPKAQEPKVKHAAPRPRAAAVHAAPKAASAPKGAMPELGAAKPKQEKAAEEPTPAPAAPAAPAGGGAGKKEAVAVSAGGGEAFPFPPYVAIVRDKVERNWNPPPGAKGLKARVTFRVLRSGRVGDTKLAEASGNFYFDQAAMRAILASSPFPPLPEGFFRDDEVFSVDLMENQ